MQEGSGISRQTAAIMSSYVGADKKWPNFSALYKDLSRSARANHYEGGWWGKDYSTLLSIARSKMQREQQVGAALESVVNELLG